MEFANNYCAQVKESDTCILAMELLVDKRASRVHPEPGPNTMWNTKYVMINGDLGMRGDYSQTGSNDQMPISSEQATRIADDYLSRVSPGTETEEPGTPSTATIRCTCDRDAQRQRLFGRSVVPQLARAFRSPARGGRVITLERTWVEGMTAVSSACLPADGLGWELAS